MARFGATPEETVMIGDRLYTDVACGNAAGIDSVLVLSGESTAQMAAESPHQPSRIEATLQTMLAL
jgi:ribonucleotide monophosphatase NagD (HAD superfamily)